MRASTNIYSKELRLPEDRAGSLNLTRADLSRADLTNAWLRRVTLRWANLDCAHFPAANLEAANIDRARAECANFHRAHLDRATVRKARLEGSHFEFAHLIEVDFTDTFLTEAEFQGALIAEAIFRGARIAGARFHGARLDGADLRGANLERATWYVRPRPTELGPGDISPECREAINELSNPDSVPATLGAAVLARVIFDSNTTLANVTVGNREETVGLADATYNGVGLTRITWPRSPLADEHVPYDARYIPIHTSLDDIIEKCIESRGSSMQRRLRGGSSGFGKSGPVKVQRPVRRFADRERSVFGTE